jgi:hypothetical protein
MDAPANVVAPVPPFAMANVPARVIVPVVVIGPPLVVIPVVPPDNATLDTVPEAVDAIILTTPEEFLKYIFSSRVLIASSPATRFPAIGAVAAVVEKYRLTAVDPDAAIFVPLRSVYYTVY